MFLSIGGSIRECMVLYIGQTMLFQTKRPPARLQHALLIDGVSQVLSFPDSPLQDRLEFLGAPIGRHFR